jgi:hypothetical protein
MTFSTGFSHAFAQTEILPPSPAAWKKYRRFALAPEIDAGIIGRKSRRQRPLHPKR